MRLKVCNFNGGAAFHDWKWSGPLFSNMTGRELTETVAQRWSVRKVFIEIL